MVKILLTLARCLLFNITCYRPQLETIYQVFLSNIETHNNIKFCRRSRVQRFRGSRFHSRPWTAFGIRIYEKNVSFVRANPKFGAKLAIIWENEHF